MSHTKNFLISSSGKLTQRAGGLRKIKISICATGMSTEQVSTASASSDTPRDQVLSCCKDQDCPKQPRVLLQLPPQHRGAKICGLKHGKHGDAALPIFPPPYPKLLSPRASAQLDQEGLDQPLAGRQPTLVQCSQRSGIALAAGRSAPGTLTLRPGFPAGPGGPWMPRGPCDATRREKETPSASSITDGPRAAGWSSGPTGIPSQAPLGW